MEEEEETQLPEADWDTPESPEASRRPPPTEEPELDAALADLVPSVAVSAAPGLRVPEEILEKKSSPRLTAAADAAYHAITEFRFKVMENRIKLLLGWLDKNMKDFLNLAVELFGSYKYHLTLCSSDVDVVVTLGPGQSPKNWLEQLQKRVRDNHQLFTFPNTIDRRDCLQTEFLGVPVDIKPIKNNRASDLAMRSSDTLRFMLEQRMKGETSSTAPSSSSSCCATTST